MKLALVLQELWMFTSPLKNRYNPTSFQLVDQQGSGKAYAGLAFELVDQDGIKHSGYLDAAGVGKAGKHAAGPVAVMFRQLHDGSSDVHSRLMIRQYYPLKITELQVRAEHTRYLDKSGISTQNRPAHICATSDFYQVEVRHLVEHSSHLPPEVPCQCPAQYGPSGVSLAEGRHTVLQVRPLRALCPLLSTDPQFCTLNLYQLALMATLSHCPFGHAAGPSRMPDPCEEMSMADWWISPEHTKAYYPLYEDVPYSSRLEIVPFDPSLYPCNDPLCGSDQQTPASVHFRADMGFGAKGSSAQIFVTHNDNVIVIAIRASCSWSQLARDADLPQVPFEEGEGNVHSGFYEAARQAYALADAYLEKFYAGQTILLCGHSQGGAIGLILGQMLLKRRACNVQLYSYGAPRAADAAFVRAAQGLTHQRMVNHDDPIPCVPGSWMNRSLSDYPPGTVLSFTHVPAAFGVLVAGLRQLLGEPYQHHGTLRHFMPMEFGRGRESHLLWGPLSETVTLHAVSRALLELKSVVPQPAGQLRQLVEVSQQFMVDSYIPSCWAALRRSQQARQARCSLVTEREVLFVDMAFEQVAQQLRDKYREEMTRTDSTFEEQVQVMNLLVREMSNVHQTRKHLCQLRFHVPSRADVYGRYAQQPALLAESLMRWEAHSESTRPDQLAMAPVDEGRSMRGGRCGMCGVEAAS